MKYSDYFCKTLKKFGYTHCFVLQGGAIMHLVNSADKFFKVIPFLHEHSATISAEYFNASSEKYKAWVLVSAGPGLTNSVSGIAGSYLESRELLIVGGQVKTSDLLLNKKITKIRQTGIQENRGTLIVKSITKATKLLSLPINSEEICKYVQLTRNKRKGPVFLEIPIDVQGQNYKSNRIKLLKKKRKVNKIKLNLKKKIDYLLQFSSRPSILFGGGINKIYFRKIRNKFKNKSIALFTTWNGADLLPETFPNNFGRPNTWGQRYSNILIQKSDLLIAVGTRLGLQQTGFNYKKFLRNGKIVHIDIDKKELRKKSLQTNLKINLDSREFLKFFKNLKIKNNKKWIDYCKKIKQLLPVNEKKNNLTSKGYISPYDFYEKISKLSKTDDSLVPCSSGGAFTTFMQTFKFKEKQTCISNKGLASMGYGLAGSIGASLANLKKRTLLFEGDGGFVQNFQELGTVIANKLNLKIFIFNDNGYASIRTTQKNYFNGKYIGCDSDTGLIFPSWKYLFKAYKIPCFEVKVNFQKNKKFLDLFNNDGAVAFIIKIDPEQTYFPKITSFISKDGKFNSNPIDLMSPNLKTNDIIKINNI